MLADVPGEGGDEHRHPVCGEVFGMDGTERADADVQREEGVRNPRKNETFSSVRAEHCGEDQLDCEDPGTDAPAAAPVASLGRGAASPLDGVSRHPPQITLVFDAMALPKGAARLDGPRENVENIRRSPAFSRPMNTPRIPSSPTRSVLRRTAPVFQSVHPHTTSP